MSQPSQSDSGSFVEAPTLYWVQLPGGRVVVREIRGTERLSQPFHFEAEVRLEEDQLGGTAASLVRKLLWFGIERDGRPARRLVGIVSEASLSAVIGGQPLLKLVLEAPVSLLRHRVDYRVFRDKSVPDIVSEVCGALGIETERRLQGSYAVRPYTVQLGESDLSFVQRLLEDEGIAYFSPDGSAGLVLADNSDAYDPTGTSLPFVAAQGMRREGDRIVEWSQVGRVSVGRVSLRDFNPDKASLDMDVSVAGPWSAGPERYDYPGEYSLPSEGTRKAGLIAESLGCAARFYRGRSDCPTLATGARWTLLDAPASLSSGEHVVRAIAHHWRRSDDAFVMSFEAHEVGAVYRPPRITPEPSLPNYLIGTVCGPGGEDIHVDELGRVKVLFPWDRLQPQDDQCSHWIPVLQDNTGESASIPRVGWEVLVGFLEGDADRPVVLGRTYNGADPFPEPLPEGQTRTALKSLTSPSRGGANVLRFDDLAGHELIYLQAQKDENVVIANDKLQEVLNAQTVEVGGDETTTIGADSSTVVGETRQLTVVGDQSLAVGGDRERRVGGDETVLISGNRSLTIGGDHQREMGAYDIVTSQLLNEQISAIDLEASLKSNTTAAAKKAQIVVGGALIEVPIFGKQEATKIMRSELIGGAYVAIAGKGTSIAANAARLTNVGGLLTIKAGEGAKLMANAALSMTAGGVAAYTGVNKITFKVGATTVSLSGGEIAVETPGTITIEGSGAASLLSDEAKLQSPAGIDRQQALLDKLKRYQKRLELIDKGNDPNASPEVKAAAERLARNNAAVERIRAGKHLYKPKEGAPETGLTQIGKDEPLPPELQDLGLTFNEELGIWEGAGGFEAGLYRSALDGSVMLVYRGTEILSPADWITNLAQGLGIPTAQYSQAGQLANAVYDVYGDSLHLVGHSLGGGLATAGYAATGAPTSSFNSAGLHWVTALTSTASGWLNRFEFGGGAGGGIQAFQVDGEILTWGQEELRGVNALAADAWGERRELDKLPGDDEDTLGARGKRHGSDYIICSLEQQKIQDIETLGGGVLEMPTACAGVVSGEG
jgi:type VI secretion system secreted protein VgrG